MVTTPPNHTHSRTYDIVNFLLWAHVICMMMKSFHEIYINLDFSSVYYTHICITACSTCWTDPDHRDAVLLPHTIETVSKFITRFLKGVSTTPSSCKPCLYSVSQSISPSLSLSPFTPPLPLPLFLSLPLSLSPSFSPSPPDSHSYVI